jgi:hypothetical protein
MATKAANGAAPEKEEETKPSFYDDEENIKKLSNFLRSREGPPVREALLMEKRVHYLKGTYRMHVEAAFIGSCVFH